MKTLFLFCCFILIWNNSSAQLVFDSERELNEYAYSNTNFSGLPTDLFLDYSEVFGDSIFLNYKAMSAEEVEQDLDALMRQLFLLEKCTISGSFKRDTLLFLIMNHYYSNNGYNAFEVPLFILDNNFAVLNEEIQRTKANWQNEAPFPTFNASEMENRNLRCVSLFIDTIVNNNVQIYWDDETFISNNDSLEIEEIKIRINGASFILNKGERFDLTNYYSVESSITQIPISIRYNNGNVQSLVLNCYIRGNIKFPINGSQTKAPIVFGSPEVQTVLYPGCNEPVIGDFIGDIDHPSLDKPFILVSGWAPLTDRRLINSFAGWPVEIHDLYRKYDSISNMMQTLREQGYDLILLQFYPPNGLLSANADELIDVINQVNQIKIQNGSYEETVVMGFSSGALTTKMALLKMEKEHLENNGSHPHTKLYISQEGEHQGVNIPLSMQSATSDMHSIRPNSLKGYALNYILTAPQSQEILRYYYTQTGTSGNPGQGPSPLRVSYLNALSQLNHSKNTFNPGYPSFTRNTSISNGMNKSDINGSFSNHFPFVKLENYLWFKETSNRKRLSAHFNQSGGNVVYERQFKPWFQWNIEKQATTGYNCLVQDNAPGGDFVVFDNPIKSLTEVMEKYKRFQNAEVNKRNVQYTFTPTISVHDTRNFNPSLTNYRMEYDFRANHLMYQDKESADDEINASQFFGYPHLKYPITHYNNYTPFDAIFTSPENTVHISSGRIVELAPEYYEEDVFNVETDIKDSLEKFVLMEADVYNGNIYIQNKKYGWNARIDFTYKADVKAEKELFLGQNVTQRTNFKEVELWSNSDIYLQAGDAIHFKPGFHAQQGATMHAKIEDLDCGTFVSYFRPSKKGSFEDNLSVSEEIESELWMKEEGKENEVRVYPNPSTGQVFIETKSTSTVLGSLYLQYRWQVNKIPST